jgi:hypothetical protein
MIDFKGFKKANKMTQSDAGKYFDCDQSFISQIETGIRSIPDEYISKALADPNLDTRCLNAESKQDIQFYDSENAPRGKRLIPLYDDVSTIGGKLQKGYSAKIVPDSKPSEWIDPGDWIKEATHAIRHYEDSMTEYPPGCVLAMKLVEEWQLVVWGRDYVIETNEYRVTKRVQRGENKDYINGYSSNTETYPDGRLIHEPLDIAWDDIGRIFLVLGHVVKNGSGTIVYTNSSK